MNTVSKTRDALLHDIDQLKHDAVQVAQDVRDHASAQVDNTRQRVSDTYLTIRENLTTRPLALFAFGFILGGLFAFRFRR